MVGLVSWRPNAQTLPGRAGHRSSRPSETRYSIATLRDYKPALFQRLQERLADRAFGFRGPAAEIADHRGHRLLCPRHQRPGHEPYGEVAPAHTLAPSGSGLAYWVRLRC